MENLEIYLSMGGYGAFIWTSYFIVTVVLMGLLFHSRRCLKKNEKLLRQLRSIQREETNE